MLSDKYGTHRGFIRLALSHVEVALGMAQIKKPSPNKVKRLVFVCHGNICRSAFADVLAATAGMNVSSFGLSTTSGKSAHQPALEAAKDMGVSLERHSTTALDDFEPEDGDYLLAMEVRQLRKLSEHPVLSKYPRGLLGRYAQPATPHLHDPYKLSPKYMNFCLTRIQTCIRSLSQRYPNAKVS